MKIKEKEFESVLHELKQIAQELGAKVRFERGDFKGGYCIVKEDKTIVINKLSTLQKKVMILTSALKELGIDDKYITPRIRELIDEIGER
jgi:mRNA-degrading endonuclease RelE of RelBE toxin-antitoxin system